MYFPRQLEYTVKRGDTLSGIAARMYGRPDLWPEIARFNHLPNGNLIVVGLKLKMPRSGEPNAPSVRMPPAKNSVLQPRPNHTASNVAFGQIPARLVRYPKVKYNLKNIPELSIETPNISMKIKMTGELSISETKDTLVEFEMSKSPTLTGQLKSEYDSKFIKSASDIKVKYDPGKRLEVSCGYTIATKINGKEFVSYNFQIIGPNQIKCSITPKPVKGTIVTVDFEGNIGFEVEITLKLNPPGQQQRASQQVSGDSVGWIVIGGLVTLGVAIIVIDAAKDVATGGVGAVETPMSWAAAMALFSRAAMAAAH